MRNFNSREYRTAGQVIAAMMAQVTTEPIVTMLAGELILVRPNETRSPEEIEQAWTSAVRWTRERRQIEATVSAQMEKLLNLDFTDLEAVIIWLRNTLRPLDQLKNGRLTCTIAEVFAANGIDSTSFPSITLNSNEEDDPERVARFLIGRALQHGSLTSYSPGFYAGLEHYGSTLKLAASASV